MQRAPNRGGAASRRSRPSTPRPARRGLSRKVCSLSLSLRLFPEPVSRPCFQTLFPEPGPLSLGPLNLGP
jgi:hypothetical protein